MSLQILDDFSEESLAKYLTKVVNDYNDDGVVYSAPYLDADSGKIVITMSQKVIYGGKVVGVLAGDIFFDTLVKLVNEQQLPKDSYCFLLDLQNSLKPV